MEDAWGRLRFLVFYLVGGMAADGVQYALMSGQFVGIGGASGAIAACMGAFSIRFASQKIRVAYFLFVLRIFYGVALVPAWVCGLAWFGADAKNLWFGGEGGVATGAHVAGFALGAAVALAMKALGLEKSLVTSEEGALAGSDHVDLMQTAIAAAARGDDTTAREKLKELLALSPSDLDAQLLLAELDLRDGIGSARFERALRGLMRGTDDTKLLSSVRHAWGVVRPETLSPAFALELAQRLARHRDRQLDEMVEALLTPVAASGERQAPQAAVQLAELAVQDRVRRDVGVHALTVIRHAVGVPKDLAARAVTLETQLSAPPQGETVSSQPAPDAPLTASDAPAAEVVLVSFRALTAEGLSVAAANGQVRSVSFSRILELHAAVVSVDARRVLLVDCVVRRRSAQAPAMALRLTSADAGVPALYPQAPAPQAWLSFVDKLVAVSRARREPPSGFAQFDSAEDATRSWA